MAAKRRNVLLTGGGKWVGLTLQMKEAMRSIPELKDALLHIASSEPLTPAGLFADCQTQIPPVSTPDLYIDQLASYCVQQDIGLIIPLLDIELPILAHHKERLAEHGVQVAVNEAELIELSNDKISFQAFCETHGIPAPRAYLPGSVHSQNGPFFCKPRRGMGSMGCYLARDPTELPTDLNRYLIQEVIEAPEFSVDAYICHDGSISIRVPRSRDKIVGGEAYRSTVGAPAEVLDVSDKLLTKMSEVGFRGAVNVQLFATPRPLVIEVNARLGSASVLSNRAVEGGLYKALLNNFLGKSTPRNRDHFIHGLQLYRFLGDMFFDGGTSPPLLYPTNSHPKDDGYDPH